MKNGAPSRPAARDANEKQKMTIDSTWLRAFKEEAREAFTKHAPFRPNAVFTDGQIRLMQV